VRKQFAGNRGKIPAAVPPRMLCCTARLGVPVKSAVLGCREHRQECLCYWSSRVGVGKLGTAVLCPKDLLGAKFAGRLNGA
jgi:hypothetical protein